MEYNEKKEEEYNSIIVELSENLIFRRTSLGSAVFVRKEDIDATYCIWAGDWTPNELRIMADYQEKNPNCTLYFDGSGKSVKIN